MPQLKEPRYPVWRMKTVVLLALLTVAGTVVLVFWASSSPVWVESLIALFIISICLFAFLTTGLYKGVRLERPPRTQPPVGRPLSEAGSGSAFAPDIPHIHIDLPGTPDAGDDLVGCLVSIVLWVAVSILVVVVLWVLQQLLIVTLPALFMGACWVCYRALRVVFAKSRRCKGRLGLSAGYGLFYSALYTGWLFVILWFSRAWVR